MASDDLSSATYAVVDVETTGLDPAVDRIVEVACVRVREGRIKGRFSSLVDPQRPIPAQASAVHGLVDADVREAPTLAEIAPLLAGLVEDAVVVAHNAAFDVAFLPFVRARPVVCTMRLAMHLVDAPNYKNQDLLLHLGLRTPALDGLPRHRALGDALVTARVLRELLSRYARSGRPPGVEGLILEIARPARLRRFNFGRYRGASIEAVPSAYLQWVVATMTDQWQDARYTAQQELLTRDLYQPIIPPIRAS